MSAPATWGRRGGIVIAVAVVVVLFIFFRLRGGEPGGVDVVTNVAVHVGRIDRATLYRYVTAYGRVEPAPPGRGTPPGAASLSPLVGGVLAVIDCVEGSHVDRGAVLFRLDSRLARVAVQRAREERDVAQRAFRRQEDLLPTEGTSQRAYDEAHGRLAQAESDLAAAETELSYLQLTAPIAGTVVNLHAQVGQHVDPGTVLAEIVDLSRLVVAADVPEREARGLEPGLPALIGLDSATASGQLTIVAKDVDPQTGTYRVQASVPPDAGLRPGQLTEIRIMTEEHQDVLVVPEVSLVTRPGEGTWIMVVDGDRAMRRDVTVGLRDRGLVEVSGEGLTAGTVVVTDDAYSLPEETIIHVVES